MCKSARSNQNQMVGHDLASTEASPRHPVERPNAPTPEQTNHWLQDMDQVPEMRPEFVVGTPNVLGSTEQFSAVCGVRASPSPSPEPVGRSDEITRPRSPTPTKMLAWEEEHETGRYQEDSDHEDRGDQTDGLISRLIAACQMNDVVKAFAFYEKLCRMGVTLYEGVYKMIIESCMRTHQLGHAMQFYETLRSSGQRISGRLVTLLIEACAREQHGDKVHALWNDWCPVGQSIGASQCEVLLVAVSALIRTMSPDLARDVIGDAIRRSDGALLTCLPDGEGELEELLHLNEAVAEEARMNGTLMEELAGHFSELRLLLEELQQRCPARGGNSVEEGWHPGLMSRLEPDELLMEDVDLDLELAAR